MRGGRALALLLAICAVVAVYGLRHSSGPLGSRDTPAPAPAPAVSGFGNVTPGLVIVNSTLGEQQEQAAGTGIVLTASGEVLTNNHVIAGATSVQAVDAGNGRTYTATVVGYDRSQDVAVLRLQGAQGLATAPLDAGAKPAVGDAVEAIGNAGGTGSLTAAAGKISALNQSIVATDQASGSSEQLTGLIQVDADVRAGDSGGPLVDSAGRVIGIDTAAGSGFSFQGGATAGFAIPIGAALPIRSQIDAARSSATVHIGPSAQLGVLIQSGPTGGGAVVVQALPGEPAARAGLAAGDMITQVGGAAVDGPSALIALIDQYHPGQSISVSWVDQGGASRSATVTLGTGPAG